MTLTRAVTFHARHRYHRAAWSDAENARRFGWTSEAPGHGHLYRVEVTVRGPLDADTQMVIDLVLLDQILAAEVVTPLDGKHLNEVVPPFADGTELPSCEALARWIWTRVGERLSGAARLDRVRVAEDDTLWAECIASS